MKQPKFKSRYGMVDVTTGKSSLAKRLAKGEKVKVRADIILDASGIGNHDGTSIEFFGEVVSVKEFSRVRP